MKKRFSIAVLLAAAVAGPAAAQNTSFDVEVEWGVIGTSDWYVVGVTPSSANVVTSTGTGNPDPDLTLQLGTRYKFINTEFGFHPFALRASVPETILLRQGAGGSLEGEAAIDWYDDSGSNFYFNMAGVLADGMQASSAIPSYRCIVHPIMEGLVFFAAAENPLVWPSGTEDFEAGPLGDDIATTISGWSIVNGSGTYTAQISDQPAGATGQDLSSTRWLTVTDTDTTNSNRVYSPAVVLSSGTAADYTFQSLINIQSIAAGTTALVVSQHNNAPYANLGGLEITDSGVNVIIVGTDDGGIGKAGASVTSPLYAYTDSGGFGTGDWIDLAFTVDFGTGEITAVATGSDGSTQATETVTGLALQGGADQNDFRFCIRNNAAGSQSTISYDNLSISGNEEITAVDQWWQIY